MVDRAASKAEEALELDKVSCILRLAETQYLVQKYMTFSAFLHRVPQSHRDRQS